MNTPIFLHYSKDELDRNFDQRGWIDNADEVIARYAPRAAAARTRWAHLSDVSYGPSADERLDVFKAAQPAGALAPIQVFVHGGRWVNFTKEDYSFVADGFCPAGIHTVMLNFTKLPTVRMPEMVEQIRRGIEWVWRNAESFGGDRAQIHVSGHSSGAHLAALCLTTDWAVRGLPSDLIRSAAFASGPYDMEPVMLSARSAYVKLEPAEVPQYSPQAHVAKVRCPVTLARAQYDTDEFRRQSSAYADGLRATGHLADFRDLAGINHFEIMEAFGEPDGALVQMALAVMAKGR